MPQHPSRFVIDARPRGPGGLLAAERVLGRPVLAHLLEASRPWSEGPIAVHARLDDHGYPARTSWPTRMRVLSSSGPVRRPKGRWSSARIVSTTHGDSAGWSGAVATPKRP